MATLNQSGAVNMAGWQPNTQPTQTQTGQGTSPPDPRTIRSPHMLASMPMIASTQDAFTRQFYGGQNVPTYRILPVQRSVK